MVILIISIIVLALSFLGIAIKLILKKNGKFSGTCFSQNQFLQGNEKESICPHCGKSSHFEKV